MSILKDKNSKILSPWIVALLSIASFIISLVLSVFTLFTLDSYIDKESYASAFILCVISSVSLFSLAFATRTRKIALIPVILGGLLIFISLLVFKDLLSKDHFSYVLSSNPVVWIFYSFLLSGPVFAVAILELHRMRRTIAWKTVAAITIVVPILLLTTIAIPVHNQSVQRDSQREEEASENAFRTDEYEREQNKLETGRALVTGELKQAAFKSVQDISTSANQNRTLPKSISSPEGYAFSEYVVQDKYKVRFCLHSTNKNSVTIAGIVDWSTKTGTMYWLSDITSSGKCNYENFNLIKL